MLGRSTGCCMHERAWNLDDGRDGFFHGVGRSIGGALGVDVEVCAEGCLDIDVKPSVEIAV